MISSIFYNGDGSTRIFPVTFKINGEDYVRVYVDNVEVVDRTKYDIINNSIVFSSDDIPAVGTDNIKIYVATSTSELGDLGAPEANITIVANSISEIVLVATQVVPNLPEILLADNNATIATTQANLAIAAMNAAEVSEANAAASATTATSQALIATTKASEASASATSASNSATTATNQATIATTKASEASASATTATNQATIATTKANEAQANAVIAQTQAGIAITKASGASASEASALSSKNASALSETNAKTSETNAAISEANALAYKNSASASAIIASAYANINWAGFSVSDGELIVTYADGLTSTPSLVDGDFIITY